MKKEELEELLIETISERQYDDFIKMMNRLLAHPYSFRSKEFIMKYRKDLGIKKFTAMAQKIETLKDGRSSVTIKSNNFISIEFQMVHMKNTIIIENLYLQGAPERPLQPMSPSYLRVIDNNYFQL